jgi:hypothetical protein
MTPTTTRTTRQEQYPIGMSGIYLGTSNSTWLGRIMEKFSTGTSLSLGERRSLNSFYEVLSPAEKSKLVSEMYRRSVSPEGSISLRSLNEISGIGSEQLSLRTLTNETGYELDLIRRRSGGLIPGFSDGGSPDSILARVSRGEYVMQSKAVQALGVDTMDKINSGYLPKFKTGGLVGGPKFKLPYMKEMLSAVNKDSQNIRGGDMIEYNINIDVAETNASADEIASKVMRQLKVNENSRRLRSNG